MTQQHLGLQFILEESQPAQDLPEIGRVSTPRLPAVLRARLEEALTAWDGDAIEQAEHDAEAAGALTALATRCQNGRIVSLLRTATEDDPTEASCV